MVLKSGKAPNFLCPNTHLLSLQHRVVVDIAMRWSIARLASPLERVLANLQGFLPSAGGV